MQRYLLLFIILFTLKYSVKGNISDPSDKLLIAEIKLEGNRITSKKIIFRELAFKINEYINRADIESVKQTSINNLNKTALFNFIEIVTTETPPGILIANVKLTERWYIWPTAYLNQTDRNFSEWWRNKDLNKLEYGFGIKVNNFRGMKETLELRYRMGNLTKYEFEYSGIHLDKAERHLLSLQSSYAEKYNIPYIIKLNKQLDIKSENYLFKNTLLELRYTYRKKYFNSHSFSLGYSDYKISDTIQSLNPYFLGLGRQRLQYFNLGYSFSRDTRDSHFYPKTGYLLVAGINRKGLGILPNEFNGTDIDLQFFGYQKLRDRLYAASALLYAMHSNVDSTFFLQSGLGYIQFVRGYEYYVANGNQSILFKSLLKYELLPMRVINLKFWPIRKFNQFNRVPVEIYTNIFFDAGYVHNKSDMFKRYENNLVNKLMYSSGIGIELTTYYDKIIGFDYSFNALGERGLFFHVKAAIR
jgi:outer membrane protein assembly factor BamA